MRGLNYQGRTATLFTFSRKWSSPWLLIDTSLNQRLCLRMGTYVPVSRMAANQVASKRKWYSLYLSNFNWYICIVSGNSATWGWSSCNQLALWTNKHGTQFFMRFNKRQKREKKNTFGPNRRGEKNLVSRIISFITLRHLWNSIKWMNKHPNDRKKEILETFASGPNYAQGVGYACRL